MGSEMCIRDRNIPLVPIAIDFKNRCFSIRQHYFVKGTFEEESQKLINQFEGVEGATRTFKMLEKME